MDTGYDFIQPEFLNILFFQQKSLVIFPYVDVKHLHSLEIFAVGYNIVDLDTTALHNLKEILELERYNSYSQNPPFFFITNVNSALLQEIMKLDNIHCIINCSEDVKPFANGNNFQFYNKKNNLFLNYTPQSLAFEKSLIISSKNISVLQDKILKIKMMATNIFSELNESGNAQAISKILSEIEPQYWDKILQFTRLFYGIEIPNIPLRPPIWEKTSRSLTSSFSDEYDVIISKNKKIAKEFTQLIHEYRSKKVNPANLEVEQLYFPRNLYDYLRTHHWKEGIDEEFLAEWVRMNISKCPLTEEDFLDFQKIFNFLGVSTEVLSDFSLNTPITTESQLKTNEIKHSEIMNTQAEKGSKVIPSADRFDQLKIWISSRLGEIETLLGINGEVKDSEELPDSIIKRIASHFKGIYLDSFLSLYKLLDKSKFIIDFIGYLDDLHSKIFGKDDTKKMPRKIKDFYFPQDLEQDLINFNRWRIKLAYPRLSQPSEITPDIENKSKRIYLKFITYFLASQVKEIARIENWNLPIYSSEIKEFVLTNYFEPAGIEQANIQKFFKCYFKLI